VINEVALAMAVFAAFGTRAVLILEFANVLLEKYQCQLDKTAHID
jgi:hypothetical protein